MKGRSTFVSFAAMATLVILFGTPPMQQSPVAHAKGGGPSNCRDCLSLGSMQTVRNLEPIGDPPLEYGERCFPKSTGFTLTEVGRDRVSNNVLVRYSWHEAESRTRARAYCPEGTLFLLSFEVLEKFRKREAEIEQETRGREAIRQEQIRKEAGDKAIIIKLLGQEKK